jgi:hypothetical protein
MVFRTVISFERGRFFEGNSKSLPGHERYIVLPGCFRKFRRRKPGFRCAQMKPGITGASRASTRADVLLI